MKNNHPVLSVIVPVYNAGQYLEQCIESILSQSFRLFELILVDDGSADNSGAICDEYRKKDNRIVVVHQSNKGVSIARNTALDLVRGEWIAFADADDYYLPGAFQHLYNVAISYNVDVVLGGFKIIVDNKEYQGSSYKECVCSNVLCDLSHPALWGYLFKTSIIQNSHIRFVPGLAYSEDRVFLFNMASRFHNIAYSSDLVYAYRRISTSACSSTNGLRNAQHQFMAANAMNDILKQYEKGTAEYEKVINEQNHIISLGIYAYVRLSFSWKTYKEYKGYYQMFFDNHNHLFFMTMKALLTYYRRKLVTFKKSPLGGGKALIDLSGIIGKKSI